MTDPSNDLSPMAVAMQWSTRVMTISLEMIVPGLLGYWADQKLGTVAVFTLLGFAIGCVAAIWHLVRLTSGASKGKPASSEEQGKGS